jgi:beta-mannosidase
MVRYQYIRKQQTDFGFGPAYSPIGIWQSVKPLQLAQGDIYVKNSVVDIFRQGPVNNLPPGQSQPWLLNVGMDYLGQLSPGVSVRVIVVNESGPTPQS